MTENTLKAGKACYALLREFEGCELKAYICPAGVPTIGYGSTGSHVKMGMVITKTEAEALLKKDLVRFEKAVLKAVAPKEPQQEEFDAMVSLAFNIGIKAFTNSTVAKRYKEGRTTEAANAFGMWKKGGGKILPGLVRRRAAETALFLSAQGSVQKQARATENGSTEVPEESVRPTATQNDKPLSKSKEVLVGGGLSAGGIMQVVSAITPKDASELKTTIQQTAIEQKGTFFDKIYFQEISAILAVLIGIFIIYKRFLGRDEGTR